MYVMSYYLSSIGNKYNELVSIDNNIVTGETVICHCKMCLLFWDMLS